MAMQRGGRAGRGNHRGGRGRGRGNHPAALVVVVELDDTLRGLVIGAQGATVKATQKATLARIQAPRQGEPGPVTVAGDSVGSVLHACCLIARQTKASSRCVCTVPALGELAATLHSTDVEDDGRRRLFETVGNAGAFVAYVLPPLPADVDRAQLAQIKDDLLFSAGAPPDETHGTAEGLGDRELYVYGVGPGTAVAEGLYRALLLHVYTAEAAAVRATAREAAAAAAAEREAASAAGSSAPLSVEAAFERGGAVVPCATAADLKPTFPPSPAVGARHLVANPRFAEAPHPFVPRGWTLAYAHWPARDELQAWAGRPIEDSLVRRGPPHGSARVADALCFEYVGGGEAAE